METSIDFLQCLESDMSLMIFSYLDDPSDLVRAASVSRFWRHFVIANGLSKQLCLKMFPQFSHITDIMEPAGGMKNVASVGPSNSVTWETLEREHKVYPFLVQVHKRKKVSGCIAGAVSASSTDNYPEESIHNTLDPRDRVRRRALYWSSKGQSKPSVPETLIYKLRSDLCVVTEIKVQPFQAYFQWGYPIYSAKYVRFRMGHPKYPKDIENDLRQIPLQQPADDKFIWTYTSPKFPMTQENHLQSFKLPEPVLCVGGFVLIELVGRVQKQDLDGLLYMCVSHVEVLGQSLSPAFGVEIRDASSGKFALKYNPGAGAAVFSDGDPCLASASPSNNALVLGNLEELLNVLQGDGGPQFDPNAWEEYEEDDIDVDEDLAL